jgi:hypothetical protein
MHEMYVMCKWLLLLYPRLQRAEPSGVSALSGDYTDSIHEIQSLAIAGSPSHAPAQRFYTVPPSVHGLTLDGRCGTIVIIGQSSTQ